jgi:hypothetical protein
MVLSLTEYEQKNLINQTPTDSMLRTWYSKLLKENQIFILQAQNEQLPITEDEINLPVRPMPLK